MTSALPAAACRLAGDALFWGSRALAATTDTRASSTSSLLDSLATGRPVIGVAWHAHTSTSVPLARRLLPGQPAAIMTLPSWRGAIMARYAARLDVRGIVLGEGLLERMQSVGRLLELTRSGFAAFLAADGPDGPAFRVKEAVAAVAERADALLVPCAVACSRAITLSWRWDRQLVPLPGARVGFFTGPALDAAQAPTGATTAALQRALDDLNAQARQALTCPLRAAVPGVS